MSKPIQPSRKPTFDNLKPRPSGKQGWQLNLRQDPAPEPPKYLLDLRQPAGMREQRFFEFLASDLRPPEFQWQEVSDDELDIDEKFAIWWTNFTGGVAAAWARLRRTVRPRRRELGVVVAVVALASLGVLIALAETPQKLAGQTANTAQPGTGIQAPGRGGVFGPLPQTGAGGWLAILENYLRLGHYPKLAPETAASQSSLPPAASQTSQSAPTGSASTSGSSSLPAGSTTTTQSAPPPASQPATQPLDPITQPVQQLTQPLTQPVQQLTQPVTSPLGL